MDDKSTNGAGNTAAFSWWDVQDDNARLPIKENVSLSELERLYMNEHTDDDAYSSANGTSPTSASGMPSSSKSSGVAGAVRSLGKAINTVAHTVDTSISAAVSNQALDPHEPRVSVIAFKLLDLVKVADKYHKQQEEKARGLAPLPSRANHAHPQSGSRFKDRSTTSNTTNAAPLPQARGGSSGSASQSSLSGGNARGSSAPARRRTTPSAGTPSASSSVGVSTARPTRAPIPAHARATSAPSAPPPVAATRPKSTKGTGGGESLLMDFGTSSASAPTKPVQHSNGMPSIINSNPTNRMTNETRAEQVKREYAERAQKQNRVWDDVDQRWVVLDEDSKGSTGASISAASASVASVLGGGFEEVKKATIVGISLDSVSNAAGKSATVQTAVHARVSEMKSNQQRAKDELRKREESRQQAENDEDSVRRRLEPKIKAWSEEHGQKKQLAALLSSLHIILWEEANWARVNLGDLLDDKKLRRCYKRATLKVHPDKTHDLDAEKRFVAKRVFDALSQAMTEYEDGKRGQ